MAKETTQPTEEQIRTRAYYLWEADGRPQGRDWEYWLRAQKECATLSAAPKASGNGPAKKPSAAPAAETRKRAASRTPAYA